jgi:hypothetical protein
LDLLLCNKSLNLLQPFNLAMDLLGSDLFVLTVGNVLQSAVLEQVA